MTMRLPHASALARTGMMGLLLALLGMPARSEQPTSEAAQAFFARYVALEQAYDPGLADLYADSAFIRTLRKPPMGEAVELIIPVGEYRTLLRQQLAVAQARGDRSSYRDIRYLAEGALVRIDASRVPGPGKKASAVSMLVGRAPDGRWLIYEESSAAPPWDR